MAIGVPVRIKVDAEKCEGHSRCYALAPELVDVDDLGNAFELNDGEVPEGLEDKAKGDRGQLSRVRHHHRGGLTL
ncbi:MAG: hypothetical protein Ct9H300mP31_00860 [Acidimicrobiaceae bacterium]|nr:MAG: hypothetical protein Ct9H300mP31_00860 [Acidimicrobiaceae bacterium]